MDWQPRLTDRKLKCVRAFQALGFEVFAADGSFNDLGMLHAPDSIRAHLPQMRLVALIKT